MQADPATAVPMIAAAVACLLHPPYREGQEDQLGALGLVVNAIVLWNTRYQNAALDQLRRDGHDAHDDDVRRLSPLGHDHINLLGRYQIQCHRSQRRATPTATRPRRSRGLTK